MAKKYSVGVKGGTLGFGVELNKSLNPSLDLRLGFSHIEAKISSFKIGSIEYNVDARADSINAVLDWYPKQNKHLFISGGLLLGNDHIDPQPTPDFVFRGIKIGQALDRFEVKTTLDYGDIAPYLGVGYSSKKDKNKGWYYTLELGLAYLGKAEAGFEIIDKSTGKIPVGLPQEEIDNELKKIEDKLEDYKIWPVVSLSWVYQF